MPDSKVTINPELVKSMMAVLNSVYPEKKDAAIELPSRVESCACGKDVPVLNFEPINTGVVIAINNVCKGCEEGHKIDRMHARIVCAKCKRVLMRIPPAKAPNGFEYLAGRSYHLESCGCCTPENPHPLIIEQAVWNRQHGIGPQADVLKNNQTKLCLP